MHALRRTGRTTSRPRRGLLGLTVVALLAALLGLPAGASAATKVRDPDRESTVPTDWVWRTAGSTPADLGALVDEGYRIVDLEVTSSAPTFSATYVHNSGSYARGWWWYYGVSFKKVKALLKENDARLLDLERYVTGGKNRFAVVMVHNKGASAKKWAWLTGATAAQRDQVAEGGYRIIDTERVKTSKGQRYSVVYVKNSGVDRNKWWHYYGLTTKQVGKKVEKHRARLVDIERNGSRWDVVMNRAGSGGWWWYVNRTASQVGALSAQLGARVTRLEPYNVNGKRRYAAILVDDLDAESKRIRNLVIDDMRGSWGFYVKRVEGGVHSGLNADAVFEPASMIKIVHALAGVREIQNSPSVDQDTLVTWYANPANPARYPGDAGYNVDRGTCAYDDEGNHLTSVAYRDELGDDVIALTLQQSDNRRTDALFRRYGVDALNDLIDLAGMTRSQINHRIGCPGKSAPVQPAQPNRLTLADAGRIYEAIETRTLVDNVHADLLLDYLSGGAISPAGPLADMVRQEADAAGLTTQERSEFLSRVESRSKGGSYGYCPTSGDCNPPTQQDRTVGGIMWLPFKVGPRTVDQGYVYGRFFNARFPCSFEVVDDDDCSAFNDQSAAMSRIAVEMWRKPVREALATW